MRLLIFIVFVIFLFYAYYHHIYPSDIVILQTTLNEFQFDMLREKQPIVIQDRIVDITSIRKPWFKYNLTKPLQLESQAPGTEVWKRNKDKYLLLHSKGTCEVIIASASQKLVDGAPDPEKSTLVAIQLKPNQSVILPFHVYYIILSKTEQPTLLDGYSVNDLVTIFLP